MSDRQRHPDHSWPHIAAIGRSFDIYYRDHARTRRMDALNAIFVAPGARVFDIGAHVGDRTGSFLRLGADVVALEPQPHVFRALRHIYARCPRATLLPVAAGASSGEIDLLLNLRNPTVSTVAPEFIDAAAGVRRWDGQVWEQRVRVPVTSLDLLIARYGEPDFVKIDVEGHEPEVLRGLSTPVAALSFEITTIQRSAAHRCVEAATELGSYEFNLSLGEEHVLRYPVWLDENQVRSELNDLPDAANSGDVYARRT